jgi:hypothetical protein
VRLKKFLNVKWLVMLYLLSSLSAAWAQKAPAAEATPEEEGA